MNALSDAVIARLYQAASVGDWPLLLDTICGSARGCFAAILQFSLADDRSRRRTAYISQDTNGLFASALDEFRGTSNPFFQPGLETKFGVVTLGGLRRNKVRNSNDLWETIRAFNFSDIARCVLSAGSSHVTVLNVYRSVEQPMWSAEDLSVIKSLQFHTRTALEIASKTIGSEEPFSAFYSLCRREVPFLVVDQKGKLVVRHRWTVPLSTHRIELAPCDRLALDRVERVRSSIEVKGAFDRQKSNVTLFKVDGVADRLLKLGPMDVLDRGLTLIVPDETCSSPQEEFLEGMAQLTTRESQCLDLLLNGLTEAEVAETLQLSLNTIKFHRKNIYQKLDVRSVRELSVLSAQYRYRDVRL